jgi:dTMP kinase
MQIKKGKFIVFDGSDSSGKQTQVAMLTNYFLEKGRKVTQIDFPRYQENFHGRLLKAALRGDFGDFISLSPYTASFLYTGDRFESSEYIKDKLASGEIVIADRFTTANMIHQGGKFTDPAERKKYLEWICELEYERLQLPKPDMILFLKVPVEISLKLLVGKKGRDLAEKSIPYLTNSLACAEAIAEDYGWVVIDCAPDGTMRSRESIHAEVVSKLESTILAKK